MTRFLTVMVLLNLTAAGLSGCYVVSPYAYPAYVPTYPPPAYVPPSPRGPSPPQPGGPQTAPTPSSGSPSQASGAQGTPQGSQKNCQTVTVEGHSETRVMQGGQRETIWVPTHEQQVCQ
jgi:hypothetical protein